MAHGLGVGGNDEPAGDQDDRQAILGQLAPLWAAHPGPQRPLGRLDL
ncbi:hypothetical protein ACX80I_15620 [Arthrobacter sp. MDT3-44]